MRERELIAWSWNDERQWDKRMELERSMVIDARMGMVIAEGDDKNWRR